MCGIVGLYLKTKALESQLGKLFQPMLVAMTDRGPDSAGFAIYGDEVADTWTKLTLRNDNPEYDWGSLADASRVVLDAEVGYAQNNTVVVFKIATAAERVEKFLLERAPEVRVLSSGHSIEIFKEAGLPEHIANTFNLGSMQGSHVIGHTRMATESAVTTEGSHPFSTGEDVCLVHNGSFSNHNRMRNMLRRQGIGFETENDTEVAAGYLTWRLRQADSLDQALENGLKHFDGFYTLAIGTRDGFAVVRDPIACKPAVLAETDDYVAMASEYQALTTLPTIESARVWEPEPATIYSWERN